MNVRRILPLAALAGTLALSSAALAGPGHHRGGPGGHVQRIVASLDLTEEQQDQLAALREEWRAERGERPERGAYASALAEELERDVPDADRLYALVDAQAAARAEHARARIDRLLAVHAILTPEQRVTLASELEAVRAEGPQRHRRGRGPGPHAE